MESPITIPILAGATSGLCGDGGVVGSRSRDSRSRSWRCLGRSRCRGTHCGGAGWPNHGLLSILNRLDLSRDFWGKLEANLASIPADLAGSIMGRLRRARSTGGFFDAANAAWEATRRDAPFRLGLGKVSDARDIETEYRDIVEADLKN